MAETSGRQIVLTGVTRGLGRALAERFIELGHTVIGCGRSAERIEELQKTYGPPHHFTAVDVADTESVERWYAQTQDRDFRPDLLINNAALINRNARLWEVPVEEFGQVIDVNIKGVYHVLRLFVPPLVARRKGVIVNFSSGWGRSTSPEVAPVLRDQVGHRGADPSAGPGIAQGHGRRGPQPGDHRYGDAAELFWRRCRQLPVGGGVECHRGPVHPAPGAARQRGQPDGAPVTGGETTDE
jgi:NAD(P)-dependent dehydrogenase (short-subunit alcohol dehydrogenase family)